LERSKLGLNLIEVGVNQAPRDLVRTTLKPPGSLLDGFTAIDGCTRLSSCKAQVRQRTPGTLRVRCLDVPCCLAQEAVGCPKCPFHLTVQFVHVAAHPQLHERLAPQDCVGAAKEGSVPTVFALLNWAVKKRGLTTEGIAERNVVEVLRCLDECHFRVCEIAQRAVQDVGAGDLIGVQNEDEFS